MTEPDFERRFGGLRRLYGPLGAQRFFDAHVVVVGIGGVGSWAAEALARSGVGRLTLIDLDHVAESNINRQVHALDTTLGQAKVEAMRERIAHVNPHCSVHVVDDFVTPDNAAQLLNTTRDVSAGPLVVLEACDQVRAKVAMADWSLRQRCHHVMVGAAGGKRLPQAVELGDLSAVTHDPLLAKVRYQLRKFHGAPKTGRMRLSVVFSREAVSAPAVNCAMDGIGAADSLTGSVGETAHDSSLNCHGYGSTVTVTATFGMVAAGHVMNVLAA